MTCSADWKLVKYYCLFEIIVCRFRTRNFKERKIILEQWKSQIFLWCSILYVIYLNCCNRRVRNNPTTAHKFFNDILKYWILHQFVEKFYELKLHIQGIIVSIFTPLFTTTTMHSDHTVFKHLQWISSQTTIAFWKSHYRHISFSELCVHFNILSSKQNGRYEFLSIPSYSPFNTHTHTHTQRLLKPFSREFIKWRSFPNLLH